jgi:lysophospholipase L1-like esterase
VKRVLVLGNSDTRGEFAPAPTWTQVARERLNADGPDYDFVERSFSPLGDSAPAFVQRLVSEHQPDLVVLPLGTFLFTVGFTWPRVRKLFGARMANRYRKAEEAFDTKTRSTGEQPGRLNTLGRRAARRALGTQPIMRRRQLEESYVRVLQALARQEDLEVIIVAYPLERGRLVKVRRIEEERALFLRSVGAEAARRHFRLLDSAPLFAVRAGEPDLLTSDGFHLERAGHQLLGEALAAAILNGIPSVAAR